MLNRMAIACSLWCGEIVKDNDADEVCMEMVSHVELRDTINAILDTVPYVTREEAVALHGLYGYVERQEALREVQGARGVIIPIPEHTMRMLVTLVNRGKS
jgi:hypothetical protein